MTTSWMLIDSLDYDMGTYEGKTEEDAIRTMYAQHYTLTEEELTDAVKRFKGKVIRVVTR